MWRHSGPGVVAHAERGSKAYGLLLLTVAERLVAGFLLGVEVVVEVVGREAARGARLGGGTGSAGTTETSWVFTRFFGGGAATVVS